MRHYFKYGIIYYNKSYPQVKDRIYIFKKVEKNKNLFFSLKVHIKELNEFNFINKTMKEFYQKFFKNTASVILSVIACALLLGGFAWAATTISSNIETAGTLSVTGLSTLGAATSTSATSTAYIYVGSDFSEDANMNFSGGDLFVRDALNVGGVTYLDGALQATSTSFFTGAATFYSTVNVTGLATLGTATSTSATTTDYLYIGPDGTEDYFNFQGGDLYVRNDAEIDGALYLGGSITLVNGETISNATDLNISFGTTAMSMATTTATTTGSVWVSAPAGTATSTVIIGGGEAGDATTNSGCLELWKENKPYKVYIDTTGAALKVAAGRCKD